MLGQHSDSHLLGYRPSNSPPLQYIQDLETRWMSLTQLWQMWRVSADAIKVENQFNFFSKKGDYPGWPWPDKWKCPNWWLDWALEMRDSPSYWLWSIKMPWALELQGNEQPGGLGGLCLRWDHSFYWHLDFERPRDYANPSLHSWPMEIDTECMLF